MTYDEKFLNEQQEKIESILMQLGGRYYAAHKDDDGAEFGDLIGSLKECEAAVEAHKAEVDAANALAEKGLMLCPKCKAEIFNNSVFCNFCGIRIADFLAEQAAAKEAAAEEPAIEEPVIEEPVVEEPVIEEPAIEDPVFEEPAIEEPVIEEPVVEEPAAFEPALPVAEPVEEKVPAGKIICDSCGAVLDDDCMFCIECGHPVSKKPAEPAAPAPEFDQVRFCSECGYRVTDVTAVFCNNCGNRLEPIGAAPAQNSSAKVKKCPFCGFSTTEPEVMFCIECGTRLE